MRASGPTPRMRSWRRRLRTWSRTRPRPPTACPSRARSEGSPRGSGAARLAGGGGATLGRARPGAGLGVHPGQERHAINALGALARCRRPGDERRHVARVAETARFASPFPSCPAVRAPASTASSPGALPVHSFADEARDERSRNTESGSVTGPWIRGEFDDVRGHAALETPSSEVERRRRARAHPPDRPSSTAGEGRPRPSMSRWPHAERSGARSGGAPGIFDTVWLSGQDDRGRTCGREHR